MVFRNINGKLRQEILERKEEGKFEIMNSQDGPILLDELKFYEVAYGSEFIEQFYQEGMNYLFDMYSVDLKCHYPNHQFQ